MTDAIKKRQLDAMIADLRIVSNPHLAPDDAKELAEELIEQRQQLYGFVTISAELDVEGLNDLKSMLSEKSPTIRVK